MEKWPEVIIPLHTNFLKLKKGFSNLEPEGQGWRIIMGVTRLLLLGLFYTIQMQIYVLFCTWLYVPNKSACTFIYGKAYLVGSIEVRAQNLLEINVHARLFGTLEYPLSLPLTQPMYLHWLAAVVDIPPLFFPIVLTSEDGWELHNLQIQVKYEKKNMNCTHNNWLLKLWTLKNQKSGNF